MSPLALAALAAGGGLGLTGCQTAPAPRVQVVTLQAADLELALTRTATGCTTDDGVAITVDDSGGRGAGWTFGPRPDGALYLAQAGALVARVLDDHGQLAYLDPMGVPLVRAAYRAGDATVSDPSRNRAGDLHLDGDAWIWRAADGRTRGRITGTTDPRVALALALPPELPPAARALVACVRLAAVTSSPAK